jgi:hypothetical protein
MSQNDVYMTFETGVCKPSLMGTNIRRPQTEGVRHDKILAGILVEVARVGGPA